MKHLKLGLRATSGHYRWLLGASLLLLGLQAWATTALPSQNVTDRRGQIQSIPDISKTRREVYRLQDFSPDYVADLEIQDSDATFRPGVIRVTERRSGRILIEVKSDELILDMPPDASNKLIRELPYVDQNVLIYEDLNFDGIEDLAIMDGQSSCDHAASYQIYLGTGTGFKHSPSFTRLAHDYCGLFDINLETKEIYTTSKDGCCGQELSAFKVRNGEPVLVRVLNNAEAGLLRETVWLDQGGKRISDSHYRWVDDNQDILLAFQLQPSDKRVVFFTPTDSRKLYYAIMDAQGVIEELYPNNSNQNFTIDANGALQFSSNGTRYMLISGGNDAKQVQMLMLNQGQRLPLNINPASVQGSLQALDPAKLDNLRPPGQNNPPAKRPSKDRKQG